MIKIKKLVNLISKKDNLFIQSHNYPDPDSIGAAVGLQYIFQNFGIKSKIIYSGQILNKTVIDIIDKYKIKLYNIDSIEIKNTDKIIVVDTQVNNSNIKIIKANYIGEIDHHNINNLSKIKYKDLQPDVGACSSIIAKYLYDLKFLKISKKIATLLLIGIFIDTNRLSRKVTKKDVDMLPYLFEYADINFLNFITINSITIDDLKLFKYGIKSFKYVNDIGIIYIKKINSPHLLAIVCDFFIQLKEINLVIGYADIGKKIFISIRSEIKKYRADKIAQMITGDMGNAGGHYNMAAGIIESGNLHINFKKYLLTIIEKIYI